jgi:hypothetical protein
MDLIAIAVILIVAGVSVWALRLRAAQAIDDFRAIWANGPWGKQLMLDFGGLEVVLVLWMVTHASAAGTWLSFAICAAAMPIFGSMAAAAYWLLAV